MVTEIKHSLRVFLLSVHAHPRNNDDDIYNSLVSRLPNLSACDIETLGIGTGNKARNMRFAWLVGGKSGKREREGERETHT